MKYAVNHRDHFTNAYAAFLFGFLNCTICMCVEFNVVLILSSLDDITNIIMKYVTLSAIANIPRFYYSSLGGENKLLKVKDMKLPITKHRSGPEPAMKGATCGMWVLRITYKIFRLIYICWFYYFFSFTSVFLNFHFMIAECKCWGNYNEMSTAEDCPRDRYPECKAADEKQNTALFDLLQRF